MPRVFPSPTLVVGLGRFGLAVLERLGDDWQGLAVSGADASLRNLRLLWVHPEQEQGDLWRQGESRTAAVAREVGEGDLPSLALDLAILRSLGLIRYRDGVYQIAVPRDAGPLELAPHAEEGGGGERLPEALRVVRRRYFDWLGLSPDPIIAVERMRRLLEHHHELDLFVTPILNRVRQGHGPAVLIAVIGRCRALAEGRDPSPWQWLREEIAVLGTGGAPDRGAVEVPLAGPWLARQRERGADIEDVAPEPLAGWRRWREGEEEERGLRLHLPAPFAPRREDLTSPLDPFKLLEVDWEASGWASESARRLRIRPVDAGPFRVGLFDHDAAAAGNAESGGLEPRLRELARLVYQGLVRLWVDLQRERVEDLDPNVRRRAYQEPLDAALRQSLELLGELLVRPIVSGPGAAAEEQAIPVAEAAGEPAPELPALPSRFLAGLRAGREDRADRAEGELAGRLAELGLRPAARASEEEAPPLLRQVALAPGEAKADLDGTAGARDAGLLALRRTVNEITRQLYDFSFLTEYRRPPSRHPPRLTVYVVGDLGEPATRAGMRDVLREIHAELLRAFSPIFEFYREGFNRCLSIVPILWMPHPADPFGGAPPAASRGEEAAIIDRVHGIRRWVESVLPRSRRRIEQIFVNGRVTDNAVLRLADAVRQTRDFISLQSRGDAGADDWLRRTAVGSGTSDLFSSFSCYEIDFPGERCREYLANRLARLCLARLRGGRAAAPPADLPVPDLAPRPAGDLAGEARRELERLTAEAGGEMAAAVSGRIGVDRTTSFRQLAGAFDETFEADFRGRIVARWVDLIRSRGRVDDFAAALRRGVAADLAGKLSEVRRHGDRLVEEYAAHGGLPAALAGFEELRAAAREQLQIEERRRQAQVELCRRHGIPPLAPIGAARRAVVEAARAKPEHGPLRFGLLVWGLLACVLGAPPAESAGYLLLGQAGLAPFGVLLGRLDGLFGGALLLALAAWLLGRHMRRAVGRVLAAIAALAEEARRLFLGGGGPPESEARPSIRSLLATRLELTAVLATRGFSLRVLERALADRQLAFRLARSAEIQAQHLARLAEDLGVRPAAGEAGATEPRDDLRNLFATRSGEAVERLIPPELLDRYFARRVGSEREEDWAPLVRRFIEEAGGFGEWRRTACLSDTEKILASCRREFDAMVETPLAEQETFAEEVGRRLCAFVARHFSNIGFGAKFVGYEGLDPDGVNVSADASLVVSPALRALFEQARRKDSCSAPPSLDVIEAGVRPTAAYMLSLVQGIRAHSVRNLKRFESFHDRVHMPDDRTFPLSQEEQHGVPLNHLSRFGAVGRLLRGGIREGAR